MPGPGDGVTGPFWEVVSRGGRRALAVPLAPCGSCGEARPVDHDARLRQLLQLAANTVHPSNDGLARIRARTARPSRWARLRAHFTRKSETAPEAPGAAPNHPEGISS